MLLKRTSLCGINKTNKNKQTKVSNPYGNKAIHRHSMFTTKNERNALKKNITVYGKMNQS